MAGGKTQMRRKARDVRAAAYTADPAAGRRLAEFATQVAAAAALARPVVSGYLPIGDEIDPCPLMAALDPSATACCLPVIGGPASALSFRAWRSGDPLVERMWGIREPAPDAPAVEPDLLLVPLLAVDRHGNRLGYGGGYYDRTLARLRRLKPVFAIGLAFEAQWVDAVPSEAYDEPLDAVLTPNGLARTGQR